MLSTKKMFYKIMGKIGANDWGSAVTLDTYTSNYYTAPCDGYVCATCKAAGNAKAAANVYGSTSDGGMTVGGWSNNTYGTWATFVRKGMRVKVAVIENGGHVYFFPLQ